MAASILVFVIACSNVANLILARTARREAELGIRAALGASSGALRRTLLSESLLLCVAGAALGMVMRCRHTDARRCPRPPMQQHQAGQRFSGADPRGVEPRTARISWVSGPSQ